MELDRDGVNDPVLLLFMALGTKEFDGDPSSSSNASKKDDEEDETTLWLSIRFLGPDPHPMTPSSTVLVDSAPGPISVPFLFLVICAKIVPKKP